MSDYRNPAPMKFGPKPGERISDTAWELAFGEWRDIANYEGLYRVSRTGLVYSVRREKILIPSLDGNGREIVDLYKAGIRDTWKVHALVATTFIGPYPEGKEINHKDGNRRNNTAENLEYVTHKENIQHAFTNGLTPLGEDRTQAKLSMDEVGQIRQQYAAGETQDSLAEKFGVSQSLISEIVNQKRWNPRSAIGWFDGGSSKNPGPGAYAWAIETADGVTYTGMRSLGVTTNNIAEYSGLIALLDRVRELNIQKIEIRGDSQLVIEQMKGNWKVKDKELKELHSRATARLAGLDVTFKWIPREENGVCDDAVKFVIKGKKGGKG